MARILLFDIDEVLLKRSGKGTPVIHNRFSFAVNKVFGVNASMSMLAGPRKTGIGKFSLPGRTDTAIMLELARLGGIPEGAAMNRLRSLWREELGYFKRNFSKYDCNLCPGVLPLLKKLADENYPAGLATGNIRGIAFMKLKKAGIKPSYFRFGAFGTESSRSRVIRSAIKDARDKLGSIKDKDVFYFGDSPLDVRGGKAAGVKVVAVASGFNSMSELSREKPDYLFPNLKDTEKIMKIIGRRS